MQCDYEPVLDAHRETWVISWGDALYLEVENIYKIDVVCQLPTPAFYVLWNEKTTTNMKSITIASLFVALVSAASATPLEKRTTVAGFDISHYQSSVDFASAYSQGGLRFVFIKATEGTTYKDPSFSDHYTKATNAGFIRGGYHFAHGDESASAQAEYFLANGGGWSNDGKTLPGMLDLEGSCGSTNWVSWINEFSNTYHGKTGRWPIIYCSPSWWQECTGNSKSFANNSPLFIAHYASSVGTIPGGWSYYTFWQYADSNPYGGDSDRFNGDLTQLKKIATG
ncbi:n,o-diacetylmuramidase [Acrodontium crateriforme]|uniref:N,O-diacetylmuramidase n=1 Tax=Acrodontium crateriforme TaxID=150365 RepID=A0AAQ3M414_9PEZI|nr:n,o-diacetylmuramidase [Acrodontium crateriforme]